LGNPLIWIKNETFTSNGAAFTEAFDFYKSNKKLSASKFRDNFVL